MMRHQGFTLLELLLAVIAFSIVAAGGYAVVHGLSDVREQQRQQAEQLRALQLAWHQIERDLTQIIDRPPRGQAAPRQAAVIGTASRIEAVRSGWSNPLGQARSELQRFRYRLQDRQLIKDRWLNTDSLAPGAETRRALVGNVRNLRLRYLDHDRVWRDRWPAGGDAESALAGTRLPLAIEFELVLDDDRRYRRRFATVALN